MTRWVLLAVVLLGGCVHEAPRLRHHESGTEATLEALRGRVVLLNYWAEWCPPCRVEMPALLEEAGRHEGVLLVAVYEGEASSRPQVEAWLARHKLGPAWARHVVWGNAALRRRYPVRGVPTTYVLGRDGATVATLVGAVETPQHQAHLRKVIEFALQQAP